MARLLTASFVVACIAASLSSSCAREAVAPVEVVEPVRHPVYGLISARPVPGFEVFGADVPEETAIPLSEVLDDPKAHQDRHIVTRATVVSVCAQKGCWMKLDGGEGRLVHVKFKDYAFFVPKDAAGATVVLHGWFEHTVQSVEELRHYLEDEGKHEEAARVTEPAHTYQIEARGVRLARG
jgi:hypothetical protein